MILITEKEICYSNGEKQIYNLFDFFKLKLNVIAFFINHNIYLFSKINSFSMILFSTFTKENKSHKLNNTNELLRYL